MFIHLHPPQAKFDRGKFKYLTDRKRIVRLHHSIGTLFVISVKYLYASADGSEFCEMVSPFYADQQTNIDYNSDSKFPHAQKRLPDSLTHTEGPGVTQSYALYLAKRTSDFPSTHKTL